MNDQPTRDETPLETFKRRQTELNTFLWTTELVYGLVKQRRILERYPADRKAWEVLKHVHSEAWFPTARSRRDGTSGRKYNGTIAQMREQLDLNFVVALWSVAAMFIAEFETFVEARFAGWYQAQQTRSRKGTAAKQGEAGDEARPRNVTIPAPAALLASLRTYFPFGVGAPIKSEIVLKADLMKWIRNLYVHRGLAKVPRDAADPEVVAWIDHVSKKGSSYSFDEAEKIAKSVIDGAAAKNRAAGPAKNLGEEFFYALFTFTNIRNFVLALDRGFPPDPKQEKKQVGAP